MVCLGPRARSLAPVWQALDAGRLYEPSGILPGAASPPVILSASFFNIKFYTIRMWLYYGLRLAAWRA